MKQAEEGMKLFKVSDNVQTDKAAAEKLKAEVDAHIAELEASLSTLTGKDNKKQRSATGKQIFDLKLTPQYIDACKVVKGLEPKHGFFLIAAEKPKEEAPRVVHPDARAEPKKDEKK